MAKRGLSAAFLVLLLVPFGLHGSDHRSPLNPPQLWAEEGRLADLFAFQDGDQLVIALSFFPKVNDSPPPYKFADVELAVHMDLTSKVTYDNASDLVHYGGTVVQPELIAPNASIKIRLDDNGGLKSKEITGLQNPEAIRLWVGKRADPFIFPTFKGRNVMAMVASIPLSSFPAGQQDWLIWAASVFGQTGGYQVDLSGRALHSVEPRLYMFDSLPPSLHVQWLKTQPAWSYQNPDGIRWYDYAPDLMIFTTRRSPGFPNGRLLTDDVVARLCEGGDCGSYERSIITGGWPRSTEPFKPPLKEFPYLPAPYDTPPAAAEPESGSF